MPVPLGEQLVPVDHLSVVAILDLQPRCRTAVRTIGLTSPLANDPFEVPIARGAEQSAAPGLDVVHVRIAEREIARSVVGGQCSDLIRYRTMVRLSKTPLARVVLLWLVRATPI